MDPASAIAGLVGLAALTAHTVKVLTRTIMEIRDTSTRFDQELASLRRLALLDCQIHRLAPQLDNSGLVFDATIFLDNLQHCQKSVQALIDQIQLRIEKMQRGGVQRRAAEISAFLRSDRVHHDREMINICTLELQLAYQDILWYDPIPMLYCGVR